MANQKDFYVSLPLFSDFAEVVRAESFSPLPEEWYVGFSDVTGSTAAIAAGRYKAVNMVGAGAIAAVANALGRRPFPFVFGGDGVSLAVSGADAPATSDALAAMASFAHAEFKLDLRAAMIPVSEIRGSGNDVRVALRCLRALRLCKVLGGRPNLVRGAGEEWPIRTSRCSARRATRPFGTVVPFGRRARA